MEIFEVQFRGKKLDAVRTADNNIYVKLPVRKNQKGEPIHEGITKDSNGWRYTIIPNFDFERTFQLWIRNDGRIACNENNSIKTFVSKAPFTPDSPNVGKLNDIAIELYKTVEQLKAYETRDIPAATMIKLRRIKLLSTLNLLGYSNINEVQSELHDSKSYFALSGIGERLKSYVNIGVYVHVEGLEKEEDVIRLNIPEGMTREELLKVAEPVKDEYSAEVAFANEQDEKREQRRSILPDYCAGASKKMSQADWLLYTRISKETAMLLLELNADILGKEQKTELSNLSKLTGKELEDRISRLIKSKDFARACEIEKRFLAREAQKLIGEVEFMLSEIGEEGRKTSVGKALQDIIQEENELIKETARVAPNEPKGITICD